MNRDLGPATREELFQESVPLPSVAEPTRIGVHAARLERPRARALGYEYAALRAGVGGIEGF
jgi:hypothetical protein